MCIRKTDALRSTPTASTAPQTELSSAQSLSRVRLCDPTDCSKPDFPSITNSRSSLKLMYMESVMPSSHLILCHPLLFLPPVPPSIRVFSNESTLHMRWAKYWSFSFSISPFNEHPGLISQNPISNSEISKLNTSCIITIYKLPGDLYDIKKSLEEH